MVDVRVDSDTERLLKYFASLALPQLTVAAIGSTDFYHKDTEKICTLIAQQLPDVPSVLLITGGVPGVPQSFAVGFHNAEKIKEPSRRIFHLLPRNTVCPFAHTGTVLEAGRDMPERREVLGRISRCLILIEGGPGAAQEAKIATESGGVVIPIGRCGGASAGQFGFVVPPNPSAVSPDLWNKITQKETSIPLEETAAAVIDCIKLLVSMKP